MTLGLPFFIFVWLFAGKDRRSSSPVDMTPRAPDRPRSKASSSVPPGTPAPSKAPAAATSSNAAKLAKYAPEPWPQVVPADVPAFPGPFWELDLPVGPGVPERAAQLLATLWGRGEGTFRTEQTRGRWITYRATQMGNGKRGVVAYKLRTPVDTEPAPGTPYVRTQAVITKPAAAAAAAAASAARDVSPGPSSAPAGVSTSLPTLKRGSSGPDVVVVQNRLGLTPDGKFGPATDAAVRSYQGSHGLQQDGIVGPQTWKSLLGVAA